MKKQVKIKTGDWCEWSSEFREALNIYKNNTQVGEKIVFENSKFRVWSIHLLPGQSIPFHKHINPYFWTILSEGASRSYYDNGSVVDTFYEQGDTAYFGELTPDNYFIHNLENIGDTTLIFTTVEFLNN